MKETFFGLAVKACTTGSSLFQSLLLFLMNSILQGIEFPVAQMCITFSPLFLCLLLQFGMLSSCSFSKPYVFFNMLKVMVTYCVLTVCKVHFKCFTWINSFNFHNILRLMLLSLLCRWRNWSTERLNNLLEMVQLLRVLSGMWTQAVLF